MCLQAAPKKKKATPVNKESSFDRRTVNIWHLYLQILYT